MLDIFKKYLECYGNVPGWFNKESVAIWDSLLLFQTRNQIKGDLLEIGVFKGKSALLSTMHARNEEHCFYVDPVFRDDFEEKIASIKKSHTHFICSRSEKILFNAELSKRGSGNFRWIHIDGEHTAQAVMNDLKISNALLSKDGVIVVDDFMSATYPQVTYGVFKYIVQNSGEISLFLSGFNKGYLGRPMALRCYLQFIRDELMDLLKERGLQKITLFKTTYPDDMNCFGIGKSWDDVEYLGPVFDKDTILI